MIRKYLHTDDERSRNSWQFALDYGFDVFEAKDEMAYPIMLKEVWGKDDLVIMETDNLPTVQQLNELEACNSMACAFPYWGLWKGGPHLIAGKFLLDHGQIHGDAIRINHLPYAVDYVDYSGLGFCKISLEAQKLISPKVFDRLEKSSSGVDNLISEELFKAGISWHLHKTFVRHNHFQALRQKVD